MVGKASSGGVSIVILGLAMLWMGAALQEREAASAPSKVLDTPNFVFILADDLGWADVGAFGSRFHETPHIDRLAREGMTFTNAYAAASICSPTRASILTGKHPARLRITDWIPGQGNRPTRRFLQVEDRGRLPLSEVTIAEVLQEAGYRTAHMGKWHLGGEGYLPTDQGFDVNVAGGHRGSPPGYFWPYERGDYQLAELAETGEEGEYLTDRLGREAAQFIRENSDRPFFLYLPFYSVHMPLEGKKELVQKYEARLDSFVLREDAVTGEEHGNVARIVQSNPVYAAMVEAMDQNVGRVLQALEETGAADSTVVIFFSDNGGLSVLTPGRQTPPTANRPLRAGKGWLYEGGTRVPLVVRWPGVTEPGSVSREPVSSVDFFSTMLAMAGLEKPEGLVQDGVSLAPLLRQEEGLDREALFWHYPHYHGSGSVPSAAVRQGNYKLVEFLEDGEVELYNLAKDLTETNDLAEKKPEKVEALRERLESWRRSVDAQMPEPNPNYAGD